MDKQTLKLAARILENLPAMDGGTMQRWIDDPKGLQDALRKALSRFQTFKTIKLGTLKDADAIRQAIVAAGGRIGNWANDLLGKKAFTVATEETEVELVIASVAELGLKGGIYLDICKQALKRGLELCPAEVGPQLRLQYRDQPMGNWLYIAMKPISGSGGSLSLFSVERDGVELYLNDNVGHPGSFWGSSIRFVFVRRK